MSPFRWWIPVLACWILLGVTWSLFIEVGSRLCIVTAGMAVLILFFQIGMAVHAFVKSHRRAGWWNVGGVICSLVGILVFLYASLIGLFLATMETDTDPFGREHPIPNTLMCGKPVPYGACDTIPVDSSAAAALVVYADFQGGMYRYDFYASDLPSGTLWLRCFEATENIPLSPDRIERRTMIRIPAHTGFRQLCRRSPFTVYEGIWGEYYAVRVEVWFRPDGGDKECRLIGKVYKMDGWMR